MAVSRTINPLHFEDLEPHRFEDLIRQLLYDFRQWYSIEAVGRLGSDDGIDIRAIERIVYREEFDAAPEDGEDVAYEKEENIQEKVWIIQCKREKSIGPKKVRTIAEDGLSNLEIKSYGYILAAACDFSKASRDAFRDEMLKYGIQEFYLWGKAEIEDFLFLPKNDYLLFAYFGFSLQISRRSKKTLVRSRLALKNKLVKVFGDIQQQSFHMVLVRDPSDTDYPYVKSVEDFLKQPQWRYWEFHGHSPIDHVSFVVERHYAYVNWEGKEWDIIDSISALRNYPDIYGLEQDAFDPGRLKSIGNAYWELNVPEENRAYAITVSPISYDRILAIDEIGDLYNEAPHLIVDYNQGSPFENKSLVYLEATRQYDIRTLRLDEGKRIKFFPKKIPDKREEYHASLLAKLDNSK